MGGKANKQQQGFTLLELLTVMTILAILSSVGIVGYKHSIKASKESVLKANLYFIHHALEQHRTDRGKYPASLEELVNVGYIRAVPIDPITGKKEWHQEVEPPDPDTEGQEPGIWKVRSTSTDPGSDGTPYNEWG